CACAITSLHAEHPTRCSRICVCSRGSSDFSANAVSRFASGCVSVRLTACKRWPTIFGNCSTTLHLRYWLPPSFQGTSELGFLAPNWCAQRSLNPSHLRLMLPAPAADPCPVSSILQRFACARTWPAC